MQVFTNPGSTTYPADDKGRTVNELRIELADNRGEGLDGQYGVIVHVSEYRGALLVTIDYGDGDWRPQVDRRTLKRPSVPTLVIDSVAIPSKGG